MWPLVCTVSAVILPVLNLSLLTSSYCTSNLSHWSLFRVTGKWMGLYQKVQEYIWILWYFWHKIFNKDCCWKGWVSGRCVYLLNNMGKIISSQHAVVHGQKSQLNSPVFLFTRRRRQRITYKPQDLRVFSSVQQPRCILTPSHHKTQACIFSSPSTPFSSCLPFWKARCVDVGKRALLPAKKKEL